jgi:hypothetical protein
LCPGFEGGCGRFVCQTHSDNGLCNECGAARRQRQLAERFLAEAERIGVGLRQSAGMALMICSFIVSSVASCAIGADGNS